MTYFDIADVPLGFNHVARFIVNANHSIIYTKAGQTQRTKTHSYPQQGRLELGLRLSD